MDHLKTTYIFNISNIISYSCSRPARFAGKEMFWQVVWILHDESYFSFLDTTSLSTDFYSSSQSQLHQSITTGHPKCMVLWLDSDAWLPSRPAKNSV